MPVGKNSINRVASTTKKSSTTTKKTTTKSAIKVSDTVNAELNSEAVNTTVLTNVSPEVVEKVVALTNVPIIAGGLIEDKQDIMTAINAGASAVSTTKQELWKM